MINPNPGSSIASSMPFRIHALICFDVA
jgi:hypothetical protein